MFVLRDSTFIHTTAHAAYKWFEQLEQHYREWHPDHIACRQLKGVGLIPGTIFVMEENLHGRRHCLRIKVTEVQPDRSIRYRIAPGLHGSFDFLPVEGGVRVIAGLRFGWQLPLIGHPLDTALRYLLRRRLVALKQHMHEEGHNLRIQLERPTNTASHLPQGTD